jgi:hypothetical protein
MPHAIQRRLKRLLMVYMLTAWGVAWATLEHTGPDLLALPWAQAAVGCFVAWVGGFAPTLNRMVTASYEGKPFRHGHEFSRDGAVSVVIGLAGYWGGMSQDTSPSLLALVLLLGGYAGTRTLSVWVDRMLKPRE